MSNLERMQDNIIIRFLSRLFDLILLNLLCVATSIPVVTIGASLTALYDVTLKIVAKEEGYVIRDYFRAFRRCFKKATAGFLIFAAAEALIVTDWLIAGKMGRAGDVIGGILMVIELVWFTGFLFIFPVTAVSEEGVIANVKRAFILPLRGMPRSGLAVLMDLLLVGVTLISARTLMIGGALWPLVGISAAAFLNSKLIRSMIKEDLCQK